MTSPAIDSDLAYRTACLLRRRIPALAEEALEALAAEMRKSAVVAREAVAGWMEVCTPPEERCPVVVSDFGGLVRRRIEILAGGDGRTKAGGLRPVLRGALLAVGANRTLASYDEHDPAGTLYLNAPLLAAHAAAAVPYGLTVSDVIMNSCVHEETHRLQYLNAPWLRQARLAAKEEVRAGRAAGDTARVLAAGRIMRASSIVIEGHASVAQEQAMPEAPVERLQAFAQRPRRMETIRLAPLVVPKRRLYTQGQLFVTGVVKHVGWGGFAAVWAGPENLPTRDEVRDPRLWCVRIHG